MLGLRWFNVLGLVMLFPALLSHDVVSWNVWHEFNLFVIAVAIAYMSIALWLSFREG